MPHPFQLRQLRLLPLCGLVCLLSAFSGATVSVHAFSESNEAVRPDILVVTIDTLRADHVGAYGYSGVDTSNLDKLASSGVLFENAVSQVPLTPPSHACMFTGTYPTVHEVRDTGGFVLSQSRLTLAEVLREHGWATAAFVGSAVLSRAFGLNQGFDTYDDKIHEAAGRSVSLEFPYRRAGEVIDRALSWIEGQSGQHPYFLWVHLFDPHTPYSPPEPFARRFSNPYDGEISYADSELGRLFSAVRKRSESRPVIQVVLSDHGEGLSDHGEFSHGVFLYDSTLRIPLIMTGPGIPAGLKVSQQARTIDLMPTLLTILGIEVPKQCQGVSLTPVFSGGQPPTGSSFSYAETLYPKINMGWAELRAMRTDKWKYVRAPRPELYDLEKDPRETVNVIEDNREVARELDDVIQSVTSQESSETPTVIGATALDPGTAEYLRALGYISVGVPRKLELTGEGVDPKDRVHILQLLEEASTTGRSVPLAERIRLLETALKEDPTNTTVYYILGEAYERIGREEDALKIYQTAVTQETTATSKIFTRMAAILGRKGDLEASIAAFENAIEIDPTDLETQNRLAIVYLMNKRFGDAERVLKGVLALDETNAKAHNSLGWLALQKGDKGTALAQFKMAVGSDPDFPETYLNLGMLYRGIGDFANARSSFEAFLSKAEGRSELQQSVARVKEALASLPK
jgi:arylsulfatase A-like enzyme/tetratricopeptide (TPR) repeat protein